MTDPLDPVDPHPSGIKLIVMHGALSVAQYAHLW